VKGIRNNLVLCIASVMMSGAAIAQDESASFDQGMQPFSTISITLDLNSGPQLVLGSNMQITGLIVDCIAPQQTWAFLTASASARNSASQLPPSLLPVKAPLPINDPAAHEPDFVLFRLNF
jgi:hypothetical protein